MIAVITHHWAKEDKFEQAKALLNRNGFAQSGARGFIYRATMLSKTDAKQITSIVLWTSDEIYDLWKASPERERVMAGADMFWTKKPESERFNLVNMTDITKSNID